MSREEKLAETIAEAEKELLQIRIDGEFDRSIELAKLLVEAKQIIDTQLKKQRLPDLQKLSLVKDWSIDYDMHCSYNDVVFNVHTATVRVYYPEDIVPSSKETIHFGKNVAFVVVETLSNEKTRASLVEIDVSKEWIIDDFSKLASTIEESALRLSQASDAKTENVVEVSPNLTKLEVYGFSFIKDESTSTFAKYSGAYDDENFSIRYPAFSETDNGSLSLIVELNKHDIISTKQAVISVEKDTVWDEQRYKDLSKKVKDFVDAF